MASRDDMIRWLDAFVQKGKGSDYLPVGLQAEGAPEVHKVVTGVSACLELFEKAVEKDAQMVLVHHGMFWDGEDRVVRGGLKKRLKCLIENDLTLVGYHLPLDANPELGNNIQAARGLGIKNPEPCGGSHGWDIGFRGELDPVSIEEFVKRGTEHFGVEPRALLYGPKEVRTVAVMCGNAWSHIGEALEMGVDAFVTGALDEPVRNIAREEGVHVIGWGHYATERAGVMALGEALGKEFGVEVEFVDVDNPL